MNCSNKVMEYRSRINSLLPSDKKVDFEDSYHGPLGTLWNVIFNQGGSGDANSSHIGYLKNIKLIEDNVSPDGKYVPSQRGKEMAIFYMAALENQLKQLDPTVERLYEIDVMSFKHE